ncbi:MAG: UrcA family protein [Sphingomonadaceae bacterium]
MFGTRFALPAFAAAIAMTMFQTAAFAETGQPRTAQVSFAGLDLASPDGQVELDARIDRAVRAVCTDSFTRDLAGRQREKACQAETRAAVGMMRDQLVANAMAGRGRNAGVVEVTPTTN